ncbi:nuclear pore complex protein nup107 [Nicotiana attenuata]|uniref:Nuclear pore complex protein nup107 n=1 Tax=Nicotiana attenuata TaxID=49451 RepID=A0A1J6IMT3_NICAT|nr:nuclear pore complex protein nup107 [Nicotiana attenuata]
MMCKMRILLKLIASFLSLFYILPLSSSITSLLVTGELIRFQAGVTLEISRLDAWYSGGDGSIEGPATYIVHGLCRRCCIPEVVLRCMQVCVSLVGSGSPPNTHDELINLVTNPETGFIRLFSQHQLQVLLFGLYPLCTGKEIIEFSYS